MKVFNLTDVSTPALKAAGLVNVPINVGGKPCPPGESVDVPEKFRGGLSGRVSVGALALDRPPANYKPMETRATILPPVTTAPSPPEPEEPPPETEYSPATSAGDEVTEDESTVVEGGKKKKRSRKGRR